MAGGVSVVLGKTVGNLAKSVGVGIRVGITLAVVVTSIASISDMSITAVVSTVADGSVARHTTMSVVNA